MSEWIAVTDILPAPGWAGGRRSSSVLIWCPESKCQFTATYDYEDQAWEFFGGVGYVRDMVSHWRALPAPPSAGVKGGA